MSACRRTTSSGRWRGAAACTDETEQYRYFLSFSLYYGKFNDFWHRFIGLCLGGPQFIAFECIEISSNRVHVKMLACYSDNNDISPRDYNMSLYCYRLPISTYSLIMLFWKYIFSVFESRGDKKKIYWKPWVLFNIKHLILLNIHYELWFLSMYHTHTAVAVHCKHGKAHRTFQTFFSLFFSGIAGDRPSTLTAHIAYVYAMFMLRVCV